MSDARPDPFRLAIRPARFEAQMRWLAEHAEPVALRSLLEPAGGNPADRRVAVTFDDGYGDFGDSVLPTLERYAVPATLFVTTGAPGVEFWWDDLARLVSSVRIDSGTFRFAVHGDTHTITLPRAASEPRRRAAAVRIASLLRSATAMERNAAMVALRETVGTSVTIEPQHRSLTRAEIRCLADHPLVTIGAHGVSHPVLPSLDVDAQRAEIEGSRAALVKMTGRPVLAFAYPNGAYTAETSRLVRQAGFDCACCSTLDAVLPGTDPFALPRLWPEDRDSVPFAHWIGRWFHA